MTPSVPPHRNDIAANMITVIEPATGWPTLNLSDVWRYRDLLVLLIWRDISARYRQSVVGYGWAIIRPVLSMLIFTFVFSYVAKISTDGVPYALFAFTGLLPWLYFSGALSSCTTSVVSGGALLRKVYFPKLILPLASVTGGLVELAIQLVVLAILIGIYRVSLGPQLLLAPVFILGAVLTALAIGLWLTALNVKYRDVGQAVPFFVQAWMWLSPVVYPSSKVPEAYRSLFALNPMVGVIEGFRWSVLNSAPPDWQMVGISFSVVGALLVTGIMYFRKTENTFADII
ncbi:MAG: ABC transporter permease [Planctomycetaceae bacterium]|nr:ABC transporter permease [Planctomycetaceae bacterium]